MSGSSPQAVTVDLLSPADLDGAQHAGVADLAARAGRGLALFFELSKGRLSGLVVFTTLVGFVLAAPRIDWILLICTVAGTTIAALAANALNQCIEVERDRCMRRTAHRPLPSGALRPGVAWLYASLMAIGGPLLLGLTVNWLSAGLAAGCLLLYVLVYTPLKTRTPLNTLVGAVVGALPPLIGWVAAAGHIDLGGWILALILFLWQIPHFLALAWMYREDYERGGFRMLPMLDPSGRQTSQVVLLYSLALAPATLYLFVRGVLSAPAALLATAAVALLLVAGWRMYRTRDLIAARRLFLASIIYLPLVLCVMLVDRGMRNTAGHGLNARPPAAIAVGPVTHALQ